MIAILKDRNPRLDEAGSKEDEPNDSGDFWFFFVCKSGGKKGEENDRSEEVEEARVGERIGGEWRGDDREDSTDKKGPKGIAKKTFRRDPEPEEGHEEEQNGGEVGGVEVDERVVIF